ncbi:MAG: tRNA threonylcarbamoyladenosine dehydratase, partial [Muribaculaceae bacterium]|nr:tRNA threonylcarbamoyladenosine dehydratase [Muribaculaceae bacterium]
MENLNKEVLSRSVRLLGEAGVRKLSEARVIVFGIGGVGSWCVEALVRSGIRHITIVDGDVVAPSNINRQLMATTETIGEPKVEALKKHLLTVAPDAEITVVDTRFSEENVAQFRLYNYDYIVDAIDSLKDKVALIEAATATKAKFYSSMGAALKLDPSKIKTAEFRKATGCPLARALRQRFKKKGRFPARKFQVVYSDELLPNLGPEPEGSRSEADLRKAQINGSLMHITAIFGMTLAGMVIKSIVEDK